MKYYYNRKLKVNARNLRTNMTHSERLLWSKIRRKQLKGRQFYRQKIIGNYIVDFYCPKAKLIIEIDGGQHYVGQVLKNDKKRTHYLENLGFKVIRFSDREVCKNIDGVIKMIYDNL